MFSYTTSSGYRALFRCLFLLLAFAWAMPAAWATHILGGDITYVYLGNNGPSNAPFRYRITLKAFVDGTTPGSNFPCGNLGNNAQIGIYNGSTNTLLQTFNIPSNCGAAIISPVTIPIVNGCTVDSTDLSIRFFLNTFTTEVNLPFSLGGYNVSFSSSARSGQIKNLSLNNGTGNTLTAFIPSPLYPNSSPQFTDNATSFICLSDTVTLANNARDPDGDRLIYEFVQPYDGRNGNPSNTYQAPDLVNYAPGYSITQPFGAGGIAEINPASGLTKYHAATPGAYVIVYQVKEYRTLSSGVEVLLSSTRREIQLLVKDCLPNNPPVANGGPPGSTPPQDFIITEGDSVSFTVGASDPDSIVLSAFGDILDGTNGYTGRRATLPTVTGQGNVQSRFSWRAPCGTRGTYPVNVRYVDKGCPPKTTNSIYNITVQAFKAPQSILGADSACGSGGIVYTYSVSSTAPDNQFRWVAIGGTVQGTAIGKQVRVLWGPQGTSGGAGTLRIVQKSANGCSDSTARSIRILPVLPVSIQPGAFNLCQGDTVRLAARGGYGRYVWTDSALGVPTGLTSTTDSVTRVYTRQSRRYIVTSVSSRGCLVRDTIAIKVIPDVASAGPDSAFCSGQAIFIGSDSVAGYRYGWTPVAGVISPGRPRTRVTLTNPGQTDQFNTFVQQATDIATGCASTDTIRVRVRPLPIVSAGPDTLTLCSRATGLLEATSSFSASFAWSPPRGLSGTTGPRVSVRDTTVDNFTPRVRRYLVTATVTGTGCQNRDSITLRTNPLPSVRPGVADSVCAGAQIILGAAPLSGYTYNWAPSQYVGNAASSQPTFIPPVAFGDTATRFTVRLRVQNQYGCLDSSSLTIRRNNLPRVTAGADKAFCSGDSISVGGLRNLRYRYAWAANSGLGSTISSQPRFSATNTPPGSLDRLITLIVQATNTISGCRASDTVALNVNSRPVVDASLQDSLVLCANDTIAIGTAARLGQNYVWTVVGGSSIGAVITAGQAQSQLVAGSNNNNRGTAFRGFLRLRAANDSTTCAATDSVRVRINPRPAITSLPAPNNLIGVACPGQSINIQALAFGSDSAINTPAFAFSWTGATQYLSATGVARPTFRYTDGFAGDSARRIRYTVRDSYVATGCANTQSYTVLVNPTPIARAGADTAVCSGQRFRVGGASEVGRSYIWLASNAGLADPISATTTGVIQNPSQRDSVRTYVMLTTDTRFPLTACSNKDSVRVTARPLPIADAGQDSAAVCALASITLGTPGIAAYSYRWTPGQGLSSDTLASPTVSLSTAGVSRYRVTVTNRQTGCVQRDSINLRTNPLPPVPLGTVRAACAGATVQVGSAAADTLAYTYNWSPTQGFANPARALVGYTAPTTAGLVTLRLTVRNRVTACQASDTLGLQVNALPVPRAGRDTAACASDTIRLAASPVSGIIYAYAGSEFVNGQGLFTRADTGQALLSDTIVLTATNSLTGCQARDTVRLTTNPRPLRTALSPYPANVCPGTASEPYGVLNQQPGYTYQWTVGGTGTLAGGQSTDSISVNWGTAFTNVPLTVTPTNGFGCRALAPTRFVVTVNSRLIPATPAPISGLTTLCLNQARDLYRTVTSPNSRYTWRYRQPGATDTARITGFNSQVPVSWSAAGIGEIWVEEISSPPPPFGECFGRSASLLVRINPSPDTNLAILSPAAVCLTPNLQVPFVLNGRDSSNYAWTVTGPGPTDTLLQSIGAIDTLRANFVAAGTYPVSVLETTNRGCPGKLRTASFVVNPTPVPAFAAGLPAYVCPTATRRTFSVATPDGASTYTWVATGGVVVEGQGTGAAGILFDTAATAFTYSVVETSAAGCPSQPISATLALDDLRPIFYGASISADNAQAELYLNLAGNATLDAGLLGYVVLRGTDAGSLSSVGTAAIAQGGQFQTYTDPAPGAVAEAPVFYAVERQNGCGVMQRSQTIPTIRLSVVGDEKERSVTANYTPLPPLTIERQLLRAKDPGQGAPQASQYQPISTVRPTDIAAGQTVLQKIAGDGFRQCFRLGASQPELPADGRITIFSNYACTDFVNALFFINLVTANGDGINDKLTFTNLGLYPDNRIRVLNRWGREVFSASNYQGDWSPTELPAATYYYDFVYSGRTYKGWFEVVK